MRHDQVRLPRAPALPRHPPNVDTLSVDGAAGEAADLALARALRRVVREQTAELQNRRGEEFIARVEEMLAGAALGRVSPNKR